MSTASPDDAPLDFEGESGSGMLQTDHVNILQELSLQVSNSSSSFITVEESKCPILQVGQYSTLTVPLRQVFTNGFADEFSLLMQLRSPQREERSVFTMLSTDGHIMMQLRISAYAVIFIGTQQRHYEFPTSGLSDGKWHHVALSVSAKQLTLYVDCSLSESVDWVYSGIGVSTDGLLMVGGIIESFETPLEGHLRQLTFLMNDPDAAQQHCSHHPPRCGGTTPKPPRSPRTNNAMENKLLSSNDLEELLVDPKDESLLSFGKTNVFVRRGSSRGDGTVPSGPKRKGSVIRGDVFLVEEDTDLLDPIFQNGRHVSPQFKPPRNGLKGNQKGKPEVPSKHLEDNITIEKKLDSSGRSSLTFPGKPTDDIIDLDNRNTPKKPSVGFPLFPKTPSDPRLSTDSNKPFEETDEHTRTVSPTPHVVTSGSLAKKTINNGGRISSQNDTHSNHRTGHSIKQPDRERPGIVTIVSKNGDLVRGSDGKMYRLHRGPPGQMGPPGQEGCPGEPGLPGFKGDKGKIGPEGSPGKKGEQGRPGPAGLPRFYLWKNTADEWAAFQIKEGSAGLPGEMGKPGIQGPPGEPGERGQPGMPGEMGEHGPRGPPGQVGAPGRDGENGEDGQPGSPGAPGSPGPWGYRGERGSKGEKGDEGLTGFKGPMGALVNLARRAKLVYLGHLVMSDHQGLGGSEGDTDQRGNVGLM
ncbi:hypothetical protein Q5P01_024455 [Channa striata]|uniref:Laminin G domain-containing protein n=1 Tax=Channa striata TaxID=64152 RepID=A0AA88IZX3_CHASR|nr:hypothetical protein Q5P01_024455 [Channa striata]